ncbi:hypothetical protein CHUAL_008827 [Chamberlinius hualienensis]
MKNFLCLLLLSWTLSAVTAKTIAKHHKAINDQPVNFSVIQAENYDYSSGSDNYTDCTPNIVVGKLGYGGTLGYYDVDFGNGADGIAIDFSNNAVGSTFAIQVKLDSKDNVENWIELEPVKTDSWCDIRQLTPDAAVTLTTGVHHVYLVIYIDNITSEGPRIDSFALAKFPDQIPKMQD